MSQHLLSISIGPVQDFIAAARRTNDLYAGSALLSRVAHEIARELRGRKAELIFPATNAPDNSPNKLLAILPSNDPAEVARACKARACQFLRDEWAKALQGLPPGQRLRIDTELASRQIDGFLEFYAAWSLWDGSDATYAAARQRVERVLAGRKALREFDQPASAGVFKGSLDPTRDQVVEPPRGEGSFPPGPLRVRRGERLDGISVLKRVWTGASARVPSTSDIAAKPYLAGEDRVALREALRGLTRLPGSRMREGLVFAGRRAEELEDAPPTEREELKRELDNIAKLVKGQPRPYLAILAADGDEMGKALSDQRTVAAHRSFSECLSRFAGQAATIVSESEGHLIYSGGDDVLALVPVHTVLKCAARLAKTFRDCTQCTLSVGVAIVHMHEPLRIGLEHARNAERAAKDAGRNRLALTVHTRGGEARMAFADWGTDPQLSRWTQWIAAFGEGLHGFPYELEELARECAGAGLPWKTVYEEAVRIYLRKDGAEKRKDQASRRTRPVAWVEDQLQEAIGTDDKCAPERLATFARELIVFRFLASYRLPMEVTS